MNQLPRLPEQPPYTDGPRPQGYSTPRSLADLAPGHEGRIAGVRLGHDARLALGSPLRVGAYVYVVEASGRGWQHVRIGFREYSVPLRVARHVVVDARPATAAAPAPTAAPPAEEAEGRAVECYEVLLTRARRKLWRVLVVHRRGTVVRSLLFDDRDTARALWSTLREEAESTTVAEFRARYALP